MFIRTGGQDSSCLVNVGKVDVTGSLHVFIRGWWFEGA